MCKGLSILSPNYRQYIKSITSSIAYFPSSKIFKNLPFFLFLLRINRYEDNYPIFPWSFYRLLLGIGHRPFPEQSIIAPLVTAMPANDGSRPGT